MKKLALIIIGILLSTECALRIINKPPLLISFVQSNSLLGHRGPPGRTVNIAGNVFRYNEEGFRAFNSSKNARDLIIWLGDSLVEAITIPKDKHFITRFDQIVKTRSLVYAAGDWGSAQELLTFQQYGAQKNPKLVILFFSSLTDFMNNELSFANHYQSVVDDIRPYAQWDQQKGLYFAKNRLIYNFFRDHSALFLTFDNLRLAHLLSQPKQSQEECERNINVLPLLGYFNTPDPRWKSAVSITGKVLQELDKEVDRAGGRLLVVYVPNDIEILDKHWEEIVAPLANSCFPRLNLDRYGMELKFREAANLAGVRAISLRKEIANDVKTGHNPFLADGHFNPHGHALVAKLLAAYVKKHRLVQ